MHRRHRGPLFFVLAVAGVSLVTTYVLNQVSGRWPTSPLAKLNAGIHKGEPES